MPQSLVWVARHAFPAVHDWAFPGRSYCGAWGRAPWRYLMGPPCPCPLTARHLQLPVSCRAHGPLSGLCLLQFWLLIVCVNTGGRSGPLGLRHWVACGGLMARQCWTVLYHGAFDPMACLAHCVQPPHPTPGLPEPLRWQAPGSRSLMPGSLSSYSYDLHLRTWPPAHSSLQVGS